MPEQPGPLEFERRVLLRLGVAAATLGGASAFVAARVSAATRSPFDPPPGVRPVAVAHTRPKPAGTATLSPLNIVSRAAWGADEHLRGKADFDRHVEKLIVHHTATRNTASDWPAQVRGIYRNTIARSYRDMPYHWLIDPNGFIYEGRWARAVPVNAVPNGEDAQHRSVRGGHALGHNARTIGIALLGNFDDHEPTPASFRALIGLTAWKCERWNIDPQAASPYRRDDDDTETFPNISGHRRVFSTDCPGRRLNAMLPLLRAAVAQHVA
ncbi:MAG: hypothetical protein JWL83_4652 [Actinomycetia bacterium]|nr:hypothetical protein [Actinomycetes bacterium]